MRSLTHGDMGEGEGRVELDPRGKELVQLSAMTVLHRTGCTSVPGPGVSVFCWSLPGREHCSLNAADTVRKASAGNTQWQKGEGEEDRYLHSQGLCQGAGEEMRGKS